MQPKRLKADKEARKKLEQTLGRLMLKPQQGNGTPASAAKWSGKTFTFPSNNQKLETIALEFGNANAPVTLVTRCNGVEQRTVCGSGTWAKGRMAYAALTEQPVAASGAWTAEDTYTAQLSFYETPFCLTVSLKFADDQLLYDCEYNVNFGPTRQPQLAGKPQ